MGLVVAPDGRGDLRRRWPVEQQAAGRVDPAAGEVAVRWQAEPADRAFRAGGRPLGGARMLP
ncbi:hypothetical protein [Saccharothrix lopnurensis]|uniref:Uncharacterized protein n=1 Tax=Saccharothrix lopnurensis TaxID=1670621 RepID=A0ABW1PA38_9PSEU